MTDLLSYELEGRIATITMDDGKANAFSIPMLEQLHEAVDQARKDEAIVVLTGREKFFSAGFDLKVFTEQPDQVVRMLNLGADLCEKILGFPTPVITAVPGHAIAAGTFLPLCADRRIGIEGPWKIGLNEVKIGLTVPLFVIEIAKQRLSPAHFQRAVVTAETYTPEGAVEAGFFDRVVAPGDLEAATAEAAAEFATLDPAAFKATKERVRGENLKSLRTAIDEELAQQ